MYFPYLRGKQFEIEALLEVNSNVFTNTLPILEPVNTSQRRLYTRLAARNIPFILIVNPYYPLSGSLSTTTVQNMIDTELSTHTNLTLGFIIDRRFNINDLNSFLASNLTRDKALIFRHNPLASDLTAINPALAATTVNYLIFDERLTNTQTRNAFVGYPNLVLLTDGFERQDRNSDYPQISTFDSHYNTWRASGWAGIGDYVTIGDHFQEGGGQVFVISLHITIETSNGLVNHHFSSTTNSSTRGLPAIKFAEANNMLINSPSIIPLNSNGLDLFRDWYNRSHNPQLGAAKKASIIHHIELLSSII